MAGIKKFYVSQQDANNPAQLQRTINTIQQNVEDEVNDIRKISILNNVTIENINVNTTATVQHKLGRKPAGYIIISRSFNSQVWNGEINDQTISLISSANVTISILVF